MIEVTAYLFGLAHGARHALEPDHVAAVSTVVAEQRTARSSMRYATLWGLGHAATLLVVGGLLFVLRREMPPWLTDAFELAVAVMLVGLGVRALIVARRCEHGHPHGPGHAHAPTQASGRGSSSARRPLLIGLVHGLAGSGALAAMVAAELPTAAAGLGFMTVYGLGATCGMAALAGVAGAPLARLARRPQAFPILVAAAGVVSIGLGGIWGAPIVSRLLAG